MKSILLVDDVEINLDVLEAGLNDKYKVFTATSGAKALELLDEYPEIAAVVTDVLMPKMSGVELIKRIKDNKATSDIAILVSTAFGDLQRDSEIRRLGVDGVIYKPISIEDVEERLERAIK